MSAMSIAGDRLALRREERASFLLGLAISCGIHGIVLAAALAVVTRNDATPPVASIEAPIVARLLPETAVEAAVLPAPESATMPSNRQPQRVERARKPLAPTPPAVDAKQPAMQEVSAASADAASEGPAETPQLVAAPPTAASSASAATVSSESVVPPSFGADYLDNPAPVYPSAARRLREQGRVLLLVDVATDGLPRQVNLAASSGSPRLDEAALAAVRQWRFVPARRGTTAVPAQVLVPIIFGLTG
jgi:periplasmic protein TonB